MYQRWRFPRYSICLNFVSKFWVCFKHFEHTPRCSTPTPRFFVFEFWVCFEHFTHTHTHTHHDAPCPPHLFCFWILGLFRTFHTHTSMLNTHICCLRMFGLLSSFRFVLTFHRHHFLFPSFGFVSNIPHIPQCSTPTLLSFVSEFSVCCQAAIKLYNAVKKIDATRLRCER